MIEVGSGLRLARGKFDVGLLTDRPELMLAFWRDARGLPVERTLEPTAGIVQHKLTMHGAVLKLNCVAAGISPRGSLSGVRMLVLAEDGIDAPMHVRDPDGNLAYLVLPSGDVKTFGVHLAVSDEDAAARFYGQVLGFSRVDNRRYDIAGAQLSFAWSPDVRPENSRGGGGLAYLTLQVMDVHEAHALLCARGAKEVQRPSDTAFAGGSTVSFIADPDGMTIELSQRPDLVAAAT